MPNVQQIHRDELLSQISVLYRNSNYIADKVFPILPVEKDSNEYRIYTRNWRVPETKRSNRGVAREFDFEVTFSTYLLEKHSLVQYVSDDDARNYDIRDLRVDMTEHLTDAIMRRKELVCSTLFTTSSWSLNVSLAATAAWSANTTVSNPIPIVDTAATSIINNSGVTPNFMILRRDGFIAAKNHVSVLDRTKYVSSDMSESMLAALFGVGELLVPTSSRDTAAEGITDSIANIWQNNAFVGYKPSKPSPLAPSSGYIFQQNRPMVKRWRAEERESEAIEVTINFQPRVVASLSGYLIAGIV